ncbi:hypothetical protein AB1N83_014109 [Pleurotus pulmonarius]
MRSTRTRGRDCNDADSRRHAGVAHSQEHAPGRFETPHRHAMASPNRRTKTNTNEARRHVNEVRKGTRKKRKELETKNADERGTPVCVDRTRKGKQRHEET